jgi:hypothetical protein
VSGVPLLLVALLLPLLLLLLLLAMERVERPLSRASVSDQIESFLETARPEEVEAFISEGLARPLDDYWKRRRLARLLPGRARERGTLPVGRDAPVPRSTT